MTIAVSYICQVSNLTQKWVLSVVCIFLVIT